MIRTALFIISLLAMLPAWGGIFTPKERVDFWRKNYTVLDSKSSARIANVYRIFDSVKSAAGSRPGVIPQLLIIKETPYGFSLPVSLPDGGIIISMDIIDRLYAEPGDADSKIAFILGHELAHLYSDDFWHVQFFRMLTLYDQPNHENPEFQNTYRAFLDNKEELIKKELFADEQGLLYMTLADFDPGVIVNSKHYQSFFDEWNHKVAALNSSKYEPLVAEDARRKAVNVRLDHIVEQSGYYRVGLLYFLANDYEKAIRLFEEYSLVFPSREVYHNLALSYHFAAASRYTPDVFVQRAMPLKFSYMLDPTERLFLNATRDAGDSDKKYYEEHLSRAIDYYKRCIQLDPDYLPAYINLATAQIGAENYYSAIGNLVDLDKELKNKYDDKYVRAALNNNLGIAFQLIGQSDKALTHFRAAIKKYDSIDARYNLARYYDLNNEQAEANRSLKQFLDVEKHGPFARLSRDLLDLPVTATDIMQPPNSEVIAGLRANSKSDSLPKTWNPLQTREYSIDGNKIRHLSFDNNVEVLLENGNIRIVAALDHYEGQTVGGIRQGLSTRQVAQKYGYTGKILHMPNGSIYNYPQEGIAFLFRDDVLYSWIIY